MRHPFHIGRNQQEYYVVLAALGGGGRGVRWEGLL